jgi:RNA polymerase sigma factor (sigma-70 family)
MHLSIVKIKLHQAVQSMSNINETIDHLFRRESGKMVSVLTRLLGLQSLETAQDIVQDSLLQAMNVWPYKGIPGNPTAWLYRAAKNKAIDILRREKKFKELSPEYAYLLQSEYGLTSTVNNLFLENEIEDSQLRMMFACGHPSIAEESQIALMLKTLCGLNNVEIAKAFLTNEETISKRIYRAREKIKTEKIELVVPQGQELRERLDAVLKSLYLLFNEGYNSSHPEQLIREDLCQEAMRLTYLLTQHAITNLSRTNALLSLMCFQSSRLQARLDDKGNIIVLKYQDRNKWFKPLMQKGFEYLAIAMENLDSSPYHIEAAIASLHASAESFEKTDWKSIYQLYEALYIQQPTPIVAMNKAIASAYANDKTVALHQLQEIDGLDDYYIYHTSIGEIYFELHNFTLAKKSYQKALTLTESRAERQLLLSKIENCEAINN